MVSRLAPRQVEFNKILLESIDEGLSCLGEIPKQLLYSQLEKNFGLDKKALQFRLDNFSYALEKIFGAGANFIEIQIMKSLHSKTNCSFEWRELTNFKFSKYVAMIKLAFLFREYEKESNPTQEAEQQIELMAKPAKKCIQTISKQE